MDNSRPIDPREPLGQQQQYQYPEQGQQMPYPGPGQYQYPGPGQQQQYQYPGQGKQMPYPGPGQQQQYQYPGQERPSYPGQEQYQYPGQGQQAPYRGQMVAGQQKSWIVTLLLCHFLGYLGVHRFYTGRIVSGIFQLLTFGGFGIWTLIDLIMIVTGNFTDGNDRPLFHEPIRGGNKNWTVAALLCMFLGYWGIHRFYTGRIVSGIFQLLTFGGFGIWTLIDLIMIYTDSFTDSLDMPLTRV